MKEVTVLLLLLCLARSSFAFPRRNCSYFVGIFSHGTIYYPWPPAQKECSACSVIMKKSEGSDGAISMIGDCHQEVATKCAHEDPKYGDAVRCVCNDEDKCNSIENNTVGQHYMDRFLEYSHASPAERKESAQAKLSCYIADYVYSRTKFIVSPGTDWPPRVTPCNTVCGFTLSKLDTNNMLFKSYCHDIPESEIKDIYMKCRPLNTTDQLKAITCGCDNAGISGYCNDVSVGRRAKEYVKHFDFVFYPKQHSANRKSKQCTHGEYEYSRQHKNVSFGSLRPRVAPCETVCGWTMSQSLQDKDKMVIQAYCHDIPVRDIQPLVGECPTTMRINGMQSIVCGCDSTKTPYCNDIGYLVRVDQFVALFDARWLPKAKEHRTPMQECVEAKFEYRRSALAVRSLNRNPNSEKVVNCPTVCGFTLTRMDEDVMLFETYCHDVPDIAVEDLRGKCPTIIKLDGYKKMVCGCDHDGSKFCNDMSDLAKAQKYVAAFDDRWPPRSSKLPQEPDEQIENDTEVRLLYK